MSLLNFDSRFSDNKSCFNTDKPSNAPISMLFTLFDDKSITVRDFCERKEPCCRLSVNVKYYNQFINRCKVKKSNIKCVTYLVGYF